MSLVLDDDSLCGIEFIDVECEDEQTSNFKYVSFPTPLSRRQSDASNDDDDSSALSPRGSCYHQNEPLGTITFNNIAT